MMHSAFGRVAVLMGGWSAEREISLVSGQAVTAALRSAGVDAHGVDAGRDIHRVLAAGRFERAFIALHGRGGEDGCIQGLLEVMGLPYTGSGVMGSAVCMHKVVTKRLWSATELPTPEFLEVGPDTDPARVQRRLGLPLIVKPALEGSSIGMTKVVSAEQLQMAFREAAATGGPVMVERWVQGAEYTVAVLGDRALPMIRLETPREFYDYRAKYQADDTRYLIPCGLPADREEALQRLALEAFQVAGASGWGRVDLMVDADDHPWLIEVNTVPGMTDHSLVPMAAAAAGLDFQSLVLSILESATTGKT